MLTFDSINANAWKVSFWLTSHILFDAPLKSTLRNDLNPLFKTTPPHGPTELMKELDNLPLLAASYHEALRMCTASITIRNALSDCIIGNSTLQAGSRIIIPYSQMMNDEQAFGPETQRFNPSRFLENKSLHKDPSFRPFGGGLTYCPGRFMVQKEILTIVALLFGKFDIELDGDAQNFPKMEMKKPCLGIMGPAVGQDLYVRLRKR